MQIMSKFKKKKLLIQESLCDEFPPEQEIETQIVRSLGFVSLVLALASAYLILRRSVN